MVPLQTKGLASYKRSLHLGLQALLGETSAPDTQSFQDAVAYCRAVIDSPQDSLQRSTSYWNRSCSEINKTLLTRYGPGIITAARNGVQDIISDHFHNHRLNVPHVNKKANFKRNYKNLSMGGLFHPSSDPLVVGCFESGTLPCALAMSAWLAPEAAVKAGIISSISVYDDYGTFAASSYKTRLRMVAIALGSACEFGDQAINAVINGSMLQCIGSGVQVTPEAAMAWRAVGGCSSPYSGYTFGTYPLEAGLVAPEVLIAIHDLLDWRSDIAAGNHENGVSAVYGLGFADPFHTYLEKVLQRATFHPVSGAYAISAMVYMHFTASRYGAYEYRCENGRPCPECVALLRDITVQSGLVWAPKQPPRGFGEGREFRDLGVRLVDDFEDHGLVQEAFGWFQYLVFTAQIWVFDALRPISAVDDAAEWC